MNAIIPIQTSGTGVPPVVLPPCGWVLYDGDCPLCLATVTRFGPMLRRHYFGLASLQTPWVQKRLGLNPNEPLAEMKLLTADGLIFGGADALLQIAKKIWWAWPLYVFAEIPGLTSLFHAIYRRIAANRNCFGGQCSISEKIITNQTKL